MSEYPFGVGVVDTMIGFPSDPDRVIYGGYFPMGLSLERIVAELPRVPFKDDVWPTFLRHNAAKVLELDAAS